MNNIKNWLSFNENKSADNQILKEIVDKLSMQYTHDLINLKFLDGLTPSVYFEYNGYPLSISLTDNSKTISVIVEIDGITENIGYFNIYEIDKIVDIIIDNYS